MTDGFYRAFEDRHRGSRDIIKTRLEVYLPFIRPLGCLYPGAAAIDLGCGRGEFLEVLESVGLSAAGVDLDAGMLDACRVRGLAVHQGDALAYLASLTDESQAVVSAFHVVEHISFDQLRQLVAEALRVLLPGGLLVMETPNPENIIVATRNFYLDPTHLRPVPPELLSFVPEYYGYKRVKTIRLQESKDLMQREVVSLQDVLEGVSPDYAVVAQKDAHLDFLAETAPAFDEQYGLSFGVLCARYDETQHAKINKAEVKAHHAESRAATAEAESRAAVVQIQAMLNSKSWRMTAPLRSASSAFRGLITNSLRPRAKKVLQRAAHYLGRHPRLKNGVLTFLNHYPRLKSRLFQIVTGNRLQIIRAQDVPIELAHLGHRARKIHADLKAAIERRQKEKS